MRHFNPAVLNSEMQYSLFVSQLIVYNYNNEFEDNSLTGLVYFRPKTVRHVKTQLTLSGEHETRERSAFDVCVIVIL